MLNLSYGTPLSQNILPNFCCVPPYIFSFWLNDCLRLIKIYIVQRLTDSASSLSSPRCCWALWSRTDSWLCRMSWRTTARPLLHLSTDGGESGNECKEPKWMPSEHQLTVCGSWEVGKKMLRKGCDRKMADARESSVSIMKLINKNYVWIGFVLERKNSKIERNSLLNLDRRKAWIQ